MKRYWIVAALLLLTGCASEMNALLKDENGTGYYTVQNVQVTYSPSIQQAIQADDQYRAGLGVQKGAVTEAAYRPFDQVLQETALEYFQKRDYNEDGVPVVVEIEVTNLDLTNSLSVILVGGKDEVGGIARVYNASTHQLLREVSVDVFERQEGVEGLIDRGMEEPREQMAQQLSQHLADQMFKPW